MKPLAQALLNLRSNAEWTIRGEDIEWVDAIQSKPSDEEIASEVARIEAQYAALEYQRQRAAEYPPITDYIDGVVKGDQAQIDAYIAACQAVKAKYPKPESV